MEAFQSLQVFERGCKRRKKHEYDGHVFNDVEGEQGFQGFVDGADETID
jgi:hypothetical protein